MNVVLGAFSRDSIQVHLLTKEAVDLYLKHLRGPDSILVFNVSSRSVDVAPLLLRISRECSLAFVLPDQKGFSQWVFQLVGLDVGQPRADQSSGQHRPTHVGPYREDLQLWTDNFSNLFDVLRRR